MRTSGVLMHVSSLPGKYGIGTMGRETYDFIDWLEKSGQTYWQILPLGPTGFGDSPYSSFSAFAGNHFFIDPDQVREDGYLYADDLTGIYWGSNLEKVDFDAVRAGWEKLAACMLRRFREDVPGDFDRFLSVNGDWIDDYALFMAIREELEELPLSQWDADIRTRQPEAMEAWHDRCAERILKHQMLQYFFFRQWDKVKKYANKHGVKILGDIPIYVPVDSADVWSNPDIFCLDEEYVPIEVSGCPPDAFSADGQLWGNPVYNFEYMKKTGYKWWTARFRQMFRMCDLVRVDHFRAFDSYYCIPNGSENAKKGVWRDGPGIDFFRTIKENLGDLPLVAEDLGFLTESVHELVRKTGYPGMKILQFAFNPWERSTYLPHNYEKNCIVYPGTHDNNTSNGWYAEDADEQTKEFFRFYTGMKEHETAAEAMMRTALASVADTAIIPMQDVLGLGGEARMNTPSTVGGNWTWRALAWQITWEKSVLLKRYTDAYGRLSEAAVK